MKTLELVGHEGCKWAAMFGRTIFRAAVDGFAGFGKGVDSSSQLEMTMHRPVPS